MSAAEDRADDVRRQDRETKESRRIGRNDAFGFCDILEGPASVGEELVPNRIGTDVSERNSRVIANALPVVLRLSKDKRQRADTFQ